MRERLKRAAVERMLALLDRLELWLNAGRD